MSQITPLINTLKRELKSQGKTYQDVAEALHLSEASVKRLFADKNFTLHRLDQVCSLLNLELTELFQKVSRDQKRLTQLTRDQEKEIAGDIILVLVAVSVINGLSFDEIITHYEISDTECISKLAQLDRMKVIELLPGNRIKLLIASNFHWLPNGPIQQFFQQKVEKDFFSSRFDKKNEKLIVCNALMSDASNAHIQQRLQRVAEEFSELQQKDYAQPNSDKSGTTMVLAIREWQFPLFNKHRR